MLGAVALDVDEGGVRMAMLASMATMLVVALAVAYEAIRSRAARVRVRHPELVG